MSQIIVDYLSLVVIICVLNQSCDHWLHNDALHFAISISLKLKEEIQMFPSCGNLIVWIFVKLAMFFLTSKRKFMQYWIFPSLLTRIFEKNPHTMLSLMLAIQFKSLCLVFSFVCLEKGVDIVEEYDKKSLCSMPLNYHHHLHYLVEFESGLAN